MYLDYHRLSQAPFSIAPDPAFLYLSGHHREALAHLMYGLESDGGFVMLTGEVGTGKTTLLRDLIDRVPQDQDVAFILNPRLTARELLETLCDELGIDYPHGAELTVKQCVDLLTKHLLASHARGRSTVMIIDEAQNLSPAVLEQIRLLTNLETNEKKLLRIILIGQPELGEMLQRKELRQLAQRITARFHLTALSPSETSAYIGHRLTVSGGNEHLFSRAACRQIHRRSKGIPRLINVLADRSLLGAYVEGRAKVSSRIVRKAAAEVLPPRRRWRLPVAAAAMVLGGASIAWLVFLLPGRASAPGPVAEAPEVTPAPPAAAPIGAHTPEPEPAGELAVRSPDAAGAGARDGPEIALASTAATAPAPASDRAVVAAAPGISRPEGTTTYDSLRAAHQAVFARWGVIIDPNQPACDQAPLAGLRCLAESGDVDDIIEMNRPVVLELWDDQRDPFYAALMAEEKGRFSVSIDETDLEVTRHDLEASWYGAYTVLWQTPPGYARSLKRDDRGPAVTWLRTHLGEATSAPVENARGDLFDGDLQTAVIAYQRTRGLRPDGIAGPRTLIHIHNDAMLPIATLR